MQQAKSNAFVDWLYSKFQKLLDYKYFDNFTGLISLLNPIVVGLQLIAVLRADNVEAVSLSMWSCFIVLQLTFGFVGLKAKNLGMIISMSLSVLISMSVIITTLLKL